MGGLKKEKFYPPFLYKVTLFNSTPEQPPQILREIS